MDAKNLRYIVFMIDDRQPPCKNADMHDGYIFADYKDARQYAMDSIKSNLSTKFVVGKFVWESEVQSMVITMVETFGFRHDKKSVQQLQIF